MKRGETNRTEQRRKVSVRRRAAVPLPRVGPPPRPVSLTARHGDGRTIAVTGHVAAVVTTTGETRTCVAVRARS